MSTESLFKLLRKQARLSDQELADRLSLSEEGVKCHITQWEKDRLILGYQAVVNPEISHDDGVSAFIEIQLTPQREQGFDKLANRIARFEEVQDCYLTSGKQDLLVIVEGRNLQEVSQFVSEKLSSLDGVISTSTHFRLKTYKQSGFLVEALDEDPERLSITP